MKDEIICVELHNLKDRYGVSYEQRVVQMGIGMIGFKVHDIKLENDKKLIVCGNKQNLDILASHLSTMSSMLTKEYENIAFDFANKIWDKVLSKKERRGY